ncbi:forespore capture DNA-binding protein RefZ [Sporolactobacillus spathodeae]|uniref:AcrR family transcriptional regulator n=1 Tax=Sporolactobacillus spathodeae TaxID=1465502 RepID=A0ABS2QAP8_9BACL|nr:AcrR family transcriptional regulator [Sporolactobacillus spathodeae]
MQQKFDSKTTGDWSSKEAVRNSALKLFNRIGADGTSVRAIAQDAGVNPALVSYYFGGKQGLLEQLMASFFEGYLKCMEASVTETLASNLTAAERLIAVADVLIAYQQENFYLSRFVHREMTRDTQLVRELMASYLMKEKFFLLQLIHESLPQLSREVLAAEFTVLQFRDLIQMPFLQPQYLQEVYYFQPSEPAFRKVYLRSIRQWAEHTAADSRRMPIPSPINA